MIFLSLIAISLIGLVAVGVYDASLMPDRPILVEKPSAEPETDILTPMPSSMPAIISDARIQHILYGDDKGGGHKHGVGRPCKSEFPHNWNDERIINVTRAIAANDNLPWERQGNGYYVAEDYAGDIKVRVVKGPQKQRVITAYPVNVPRNPCPANTP